MNLTRENVVVAVGALAAIVLQVAVAPNVAIFAAQPNFLLAYVLTVAIANPLGAGPVLPFALGLLFDLLGTGPVGGMSLLFTLASLAASRAFAVLDNDTLFMPLAILVAASFAVETLYGILLVALGSPVGLADAFFYRALPCALYDCVVALVLYPLVVRLVSGAAQDRGPRTPRLR